MKQITYRATYQKPDGGTTVEIIEVSARDINGGLKKALTRALDGLRDLDWELCSLEFWAVV